MRIQGKKLPDLPKLLRNDGPSGGGPIACCWTDFYPCLAAMVVIVPMVAMITAVFVAAAPVISVKVSAIIGVEMPTISARRK